MKRVLSWACLLALLALSHRAAAQALDASLTNATIKVGVSRTYGGGIVWLSTNGGTNLVNNYDKGRQIQQSYYAGSNITAANQSSSWSPWPWNPITVGDYAGHASPVLVLANNAGQIYVKTQPFLWDRNNQLSQSLMEQWISLHPTLTNVVVVDSRFTCFRDPNDPWGGPVLRDQELPAVYLVSALNTIKAYTNNLPWANEPLVTIPNTPSSGSFPWVRYVPTEPWTACVDATGFGAGVYTPVATSFLAGKAGTALSWNTFHSSTMYIAPLGRYAFGTNAVFSYRYYLTVGNLADIRSTVYTLHSASSTPPLSPTSLTASAGNEQVSLTWNPSPETTHYHVKCATANVGPYILVASVTTTAYTHVGLTNGSTNYYIVSASNAVGEGADTPAVSATPAPVIAVPNFGFETPSISAYQYAPIAGASWTFTGGAGISRNGSAFTSLNPTAPEGVQVGLLQGPGATISQLLAGFPVGASCTVTFTAAQRVSPINGGQTWNLTINGSVIGSFAPPPTATGYVEYTASFSATASSNTVAFVGTNLHGGDNTVFIDQVRIHYLTPAQSWASHYGVPVDNGDADGDGLSNEAEFLAGFNPTNGAAYIRVISVTRSDDDLNIVYLGANGDTSYPSGPAVCTNVLEYTEALTNNFISAGQTNILGGGTGTGIVTNFFVPDGAAFSPAHFYRVRVVTP